MPFWVSRAKFVLPLQIVFLLLVGALPGTGSAASLQQQAAAVPDISARAAIVVEYPSGRILYAKDPHAQLAPASTTKILTAILAMEYGKLDETMTVAPEDLVGQSTMGLQSGEEQKLRDLLYGMLLPSGNDAAMTIARTLGSKVVTTDPTLKDPVARFVKMMNVRVQQLGLTDSRFINSHGLDADGHVSSAYDLASLAWYALHFPIFNDIVRQVSYDAPGHPLLNTNEMLTRYPGADGIKTGWTDAGGLCLVTSATRDGRRLISVVLNAPRWYADSTDILNYGFAQLAAQPQDDKAETLSISRRGTVSWLLVNASAAPAMPGAVEGLTAQGGGLAPLPAADKNKVVAMAALPGNSQQAPQSANTPLMAATQPTSSLLWMLAIFGVIGLACCYLALKLWGVRPALFFAGKRSMSAAPYKGVSLPAHSRSATYSQMRPVTATLGRPPTPSRREPNLLLTRQEKIALHVEQAVALAWEEKQGSSMSEFLSALRSGVELQAEVVAQSYQMNASAYLALSRAQLAVGRRDNARHTLVCGLSALPQQRILRLALQQLQDRS